MKTLAVVSGVLWTLREVKVEGRRTTYKVRIGNVSLEKYLAEHCEDGGYFRIQFQNQETHALREIIGQLDIFIQKKDVGYYHNGWRVNQEVTREYRVNFGGEPIATTIGNLFEHQATRTFYDQGRHRITLTKLW